MSARKIAYNTIAQIAGKFLGFFISSFILIILASELSTVGMGHYNTVTAFVAFFVTLGDLGINLVLMREISQRPDKAQAITAEFLGFRVVYSLAIMLLAPLLALLIPQYAAFVVKGIAIAAFAQFILLINQTFVSVLQVRLQMDKAVVAELVNRALTLGAVVYAARVSTDVEAFFFAVLWITVIAAVVNMVVSYFFAGRIWPIRPVFHVSRWNEILRLVIPMGMFTFLGVVHFKGDMIILSLLKGPYDVGVYGYAYKIGEILFSIPLMFIGVVYPQMSALHKGNKDDFLQLCQKIFSVLWFFALPFMAGIYLLAPYFTTLLSRQSVTDGILAGHVLQILSIATVLWFFGAFYQHILLAGTDYRGLIRSLLIAGVLNICLNLIFIPHFTFYGAATITVVTELVMLGLTIRYVKDRTGFVAHLRGIGPIIVSTVVMAGAVLAVRHFFFLPVTDFASAARIYQLFTLFALGAVGALIYSGVLLLWGRQSPLYTVIGMLKK